jgi:hypothetical protein
MQTGEPENRHTLLWVVSTCQRVNTNNVNSMSLLLAWRSLPTGHAFFMFDLFDQ